MRVHGSKVRVRLTEADLEPNESRPMLRVAPALATLVWFGSIALATTIYLEWLPARALFEQAHAEQRGAPNEPLAAGSPLGGSRVAGALTRPQPHVAPGPAVSKSGAPPAAAHPRSDRPVETPAPVASAGAQPPKPASAATAITQPESIPESTRTIRGSYFSDNTNWAGGW